MSRPVSESDPMSRPWKAIERFWKTATLRPRAMFHALNSLPSLYRAYAFARTYSNCSALASDASNASPGNPLWDYFQANTQGPGIWKWEHYFEVYHRHFAPFIGQPVNVLEIGIYSGGSLGMWRSYFGERSHIYGVDIEEACKTYESEHISVLIGDQADRAFWQSFRNRAERIDIVIDDGGHTPRQQRVTLEEMLPYLPPGGVYLCEDIHGRGNRFAAFASALVDELNGMKPKKPSMFQTSVHSIHFYPFLLVIEKHRVPPTELVSTRRGTEWQPFL